MAYVKLIETHTAEQEYLFEAFLEREGLQFRRVKPGTLSFFGLFHDSPLHGAVFYVDKNDLEKAKLALNQFEIEFSNYLETRCPQCGAERYPGYESCWKCSYIFSGEKDDSPFYTFYAPREDDDEAGGSLKMILGLLILFLLGLYILRYW